MQAADFIRLAALVAPSVLPFLSVSNLQCPVHLCLFVCLLVVRLTTVGRPAVFVLKFPTCHCCAPLLAQTSLLPSSVVVYKFNGKFAYSKQ